MEPKTKKAENRQTAKCDRRVETPEEYKARRYAQRRAWALANPEKTRSYGRKHYRKNTAARIRNSSTYYYAHKAARSAYSKDYYRKRKAQLEAEKHGAAPAPRRNYTPLVIRQVMSPAERKMRRCERTLNRYAYDAMARAKSLCEKKVDAYFERYPFERAERAVKRYLFRFGIRRDSGMYDDCYDAGMLAYLYSIHRCAVIDCVNVDGYLCKMIRIYILCALVLYRDSENLCRENGLHLVRIDDEGAQRHV